MAGKVFSVEKVKEFWRNQYQDPHAFAQNFKLAKAGGLFMAAVVVMRTFGDAMAI